MGSVSYVFKGAVENGLKIIGRRLGVLVPTTIRPCTGVNYLSSWHLFGDEPNIWLDPNFFIIYGPNSSTGHNSVLFTIENMVDYALKVAEPVIRGEASEIEVKEEAEKGHLRRLQEASSDKLWHTCKNVRLFFSYLQPLPEAVQSCSGM
jgi:hypothetical protein